jgi:hypothetical protein
MEAGCEVAKLDLAGSRYGRGAGYFGQDNEVLVSQQARNFLTS